MNIICYALSQKYSGANATVYSRYVYLQYSRISGFWARYTRTVHMLTKAVASAPAVTGHAASMQRFRFILGQCDRIACTSYTLNIFPWKLNNLHGWKYEMLSNYILKSHSPSKLRKFSCTVHEQQGYEFSFYSSPHLAFLKLS